MTVKEHLGNKIIYDKDGQDIWSICPKGLMTKVADLRGWGAIQQLFKRPDGSINFKAVGDFQDEIGRFVAQAIGEKLQQE